MQPGVKCWDSLRLFPRQWTQLEKNLPVLPAKTLGHDQYVDCCLLLKDMSTCPSSSEGSTWPPQSCPVQGKTTYKSDLQVFCMWTAPDFPSNLIKANEKENLCSSHQQNDREDVNLGTSFFAKQEKPVLCPLPDLCWHDDKPKRKPTVSCGSGNIFNNVCTHKYLGADKAAVAMRGLERPTSSPW